MFRANFCMYGMKEAAWVKQIPSYRTCSATFPRSEPRLPQQQDTIPNAVKNLSLALLKMGNSLPETCWADLGDQYIVIVASRWFSILLYLHCAYLQGLYLNELCFCFLGSIFYFVSLQSLIIKPDEKKRLGVYGTNWNSVLTHSLP